MNPTASAMDNPYLDTIISLVLVYALLSVLVSSILEGWNRHTKQRGVFLQRVIFRLLDDPINKSYGHGVYQHPAINKIRRDGNSFPNYIAAETFSTALIESLADQAQQVAFRAHIGGVDVEDQFQANTLTPAERAQMVFKKVVITALPANATMGDRLIHGVGTMADSEFKQQLTNFIDRNTKAIKPDPNGPEVWRLDMDALKTEMGRWFDDYMDRCTGEYKDGQRWKLRFVGLIVALGLNVDSLHLAKVFLLDEGLRDSMVAQAEQVADRYEVEKRRMNSDTLDTEGYLRALGVPLSDSASKADVHMAVDSMSKVFTLMDDTLKRQTEQVLTLVSNWQLPIGWNRTEAPWSWFKCVGGKQLKAVPKEFKPSQRALLKHFQKRNRPGFGNFIKWAAGIFITAWSLSMGAPFWFEAIAKLINIRRTGPKPKATN